MTSASGSSSARQCRALQSASILGRRLDLSVVVEFDLREWSPDLTCTYDTEAVVEAASAEYKRYRGEWPVGERRAWEPRSMLHARVWGVLQRYTEVDRAAVVCHAGVIQTLTGLNVALGDVIEFRFDATSR